MNPARSLHGNGHLAESVGELLRRLDDLLIRGHRMDELDELHDLSPD